MKRTVLSEDVKYLDGKRITVQTIETITTLSDDIATLAGYQAALAEHQKALECLAQSTPADEAQAAEINCESTRIRQEMRILRDAIQIQEGHIRGFEDGD